MSELLTSAQMRAVETAAIASGTVTGLALMERAGAGVVEGILARWPESAGTAGRAVVLCGPGNNGGDGYVVARLLAVRGWQVRVKQLGDPALLPPDAAVNHRRWCEIGPVHPLPEVASSGETAFEPDIVVDALFGIGLKRPVEIAFDPARARVVAVDIPSGLCADSGRVIGERVLRADLTVTFHRAKPGHWLAQGPAVCGALRVVDIGLAGTPVQGALGLVDAPDPVRLAKSPEQHKYGYGHALVVAGGAGRGGAARLAARAALRVGAGLVTVAPTPGALQENAARLDAVMLAPVADGEALGRLIADGRLNTICLGPGLGIERAKALVPVALRQDDRSVVLDADALTAFSDAPEVLFEQLHDGCLLTPHGGEFARLFPDLADRLAAPATSGPAYSKVDAVRAAAARAGCTLLLKGPDTVIAAPDGQVRLHSASHGRAAPWLATAGSGDALAGIVTGFMARGLSPLDAASTGTWLHVEAARSFGPGLIAEDLADALPQAFRALGL
ncbi:NAD(P)H-hydrate dehydratase [uncultured Maritimibacter sp.]|jgi:hydroxyethylthiazole kinase-like uncharacterized protein yjeF|uniref:NAD(P)H-hydrate dehydratase n=1 Tax=uncultured Maritimibacter sp. TaxID=991866 RepID=UPI000A943F06|nr:NAD(P)H-hydrate dehydratase [uncultured Maritimibacter sp.]